MSVTPGQFIAATCPNCNSPLNVEQGQHYAKCEYCGTVNYVPDAVSYHEHRNTNYNFSGPTTVQVHAGQDLETLVKNAEAHMRLKNFSEAEKLYMRVSKEYPDDYRGWWGLARINRDDFKCLPRTPADWERCLHYYKVATQVASVHDREQMRQKMESARAAALNTLRQQYSSFCTEEQQVLNMLPKASAELKQADALLKAKEADYSSVAKILKDESSANFSKNILLVIAGLCVGFILLVFSPYFQGRHSSLTATDGIAFFIPSFIAVICLVKARHIPRRYKEANMKKSQLSLEIQELRQIVYSSELSSLEGRSANIKTEKQRIENLITWFQELKF